MPDYTKDKRIRIITGHYGSGKTEFAINYAMAIAPYYEKTAIADLDVVNTYFRSRERQALLETHGIELISGNAQFSSLDVPAVSAEVMRPMEDSRYSLVMDIGGNPDGTKVLGRYKKTLAERGVDHFFVINRNRPETKTVAQVTEFIKRIEGITSLPVTGLVNSTHMLKETTAEDIRYGQALCDEVSDALGIPVRYIACLKHLLDDLPNEWLDKVPPITLALRESWML